MASVNNMGFNQLSAVLNTIHQQATGVTDIAAINNTSDFISLAQTTLKAGYEPVLNAISQVLSRTIFSVRPYSRKFKGIFVDEQRWGGHVRKINYVDQPALNDSAYPEGDADASCDQYMIRKPQVVQTNFYGYNTYSDVVPIYMEQLDTAFSGPDEFGSFISGLLTNISNKHEQYHEEMARTALANFIGGKIVNDTTNVIHLITEYNAQLGLTGDAALTSTTVYLPENYPSFVKWLYSRVAGICSLMTERSIKFHTNFDVGNITRHTPYDMQRVYLLARPRYEMEMMAIADIFHDTYLKMADTETVNYWQAIDEPDTINIKPSFITSTGAVAEASAALNQANVFGVIFDREAVGISTHYNRTINTPINARCRYYNIWWNFQDRYWNDFSENGVVLLLN